MQITLFLQTFFFHETEKVLCIFKKNPFCHDLNNRLYTQVVDNGRIIKGFFWSIMDHYSQDAHWKMITSNEILGGISKWYIIAIICYL